MGFLRSIAVCLATAVLWAAAPTAEQLAKQAEKAEREGKIIEAYLLYSQAAAAEPRNTLYWTRASALRPQATLMSEKKLAPLGVVDPPPPATPLIEGGLTRQQLADIERLTGPPRLRKVEGTQSFHLRADVKDVFEKVASAFGYTVIFDKDFGSQVTFRFDIENVDYLAALHALEGAANAFIVPLSDKAMLVAPDTPQKRQDLEPNEAIGIPIPQRTSAQEAQELMMAVQQAMEIRHAALDPVKRLVFLRDRASKVEMARALFADLAIGKPQVSVEVEFLSTSANSSLNYGLTIPSNFPLVNFGKWLNSTPSVPTGFANFLTFGGGATFMGIGLTDPSMFATASRSDATTLLRSHIVTSDGVAATLHVGDKYPIQSNAYIGSNGLNSSSVTYAVLSTASYADVTTTAVSATGNMKLVINGTAVPFTLPAGTNNLIGLETVINSLGAGVASDTVQRGTTDRPYSFAVIGSSLSVTSIDLIDDPDGAQISLVKKVDIESVLSKKLYADTDTTPVSDTGFLNLTIGSTVTPLTLTSTTNTLAGLRDAINSAGAGVTASVLTTGSTTANPYYLQIVGGSNSITSIQVYDDPTGANTALFSSTTEVNTITSSLGTTVTTSSTTSSLGQVYTPTPTFTFEDLGLVLKITPFVHDLDEITLDVEAEFKVLGSGSYNGVPVISARKFQGKLRLRTDQWAVVAGLVSTSQSKSLTGFPGLAQVPLFGQLLSQNTKSKDTTNLLIVIKPTVTSLPSSEKPTRLYWIGSEMKPLTLL